MAKKYDLINPDHYKRYSTETIDMMVKIWGHEKTSTFCEMSAFKYRMRMGTKPGADIQTDIEKEAWYLKMADTLRRPEEQPLKES